MFLAQIKLAQTFLNLVLKIIDDDDFLRLMFLAILVVFLIWKLPVISVPVGIKLLIFCCIDSDLLKCFHLFDCDLNYCAYVYLYKTLYVTKLIQNDLNAIFLKDLSVLNILCVYVFLGTLMFEFLTVVYHRTLAYWPEPPAFRIEPYIILLIISKFECIIHKKTHG